VFTTPLQLRGITVAVLQVARSTGSLDETRRLLALALLGTGGAGLAVSLGLGWWLAGLTLSPVRRVTQTAREIALSGEPDRRLDYHGPHDELGVLAATFNTMLDRLSTVLAAQRRFVADASHELRTPMTTLRLNLHSLLRQPYDDDPDERREVLRDMADEIDRLSRLVAGLLELARADAGRRPPSEPVALDEVAREVAHTLAPLAAGRLGLDRLDPVDVTGSRDGLRQVLLILVDNALKFSPPDRPISLRVQLDRAMGRVLLEVEDRGPGIATEDLPHLFERFYRSAAARQTSGTGLGLAIARTIVEEHGGTIVVESALGRGSTFRVSLPLARERAGAVRPRVERPAPSVGAAR
jgi:two-component system OmpR family sensor kinase